jgi:multidrug efflux pump subunit AcrA (membrane-fusion protein)
VSRFSRALAAAAFGIFAVALLADCNRSTHTGRRGAGAGASAAPAGVPTSRAQETTVRPTISIAGIIAPLQNVAITSSLTEPADAVLVQEGDHVRRGQRLAVLDTADLRAQYESEVRTAASDDAKIAQARYDAQLQFGQNPQQVSQAQQALRQAKQTLQQDQVNLIRDRQLLHSGYVAQQTYDQQATLVNNDRASVLSAQAALNSAIVNQRVNGSPSRGLQASTIQSAIADAASAHAAAQQTMTSIVKAVLYSPVDGVVVNRNFNLGEYPSGRTLFTVQQLSSVYAELNASSSQVFALQRGAAVRMTAAVAGNPTYTGTVVGVLGQVTPGATNFTVKTVVGNADLRLQSGIPVTATVSLPPTRGIGIPETAFLDDTHTTVIVDANGTAKVANVKEIASDGTTSVVSGLASGETVVTDGQLGITSGQKLSER